MKLGQRKFGTKCLFHESSRFDKCHLTNHVASYNSRGALEPRNVLESHSATSPSVFIINEFSFHPGHIVVIDIDI